MNARRWAAGAAVLLAALGALSLRVASDTTLAPPSPSPAPAPRAALVPPAPAPTPAPLPPVPEDPPPRGDALEAAYEAIRALEQEAYGTPLVWDASIPPTHHPDQVIPTIERALEACGVEARLLDFDCDEPPCFALLDVTGQPSWHRDLVGHCPVWRDTWGTFVSQATRLVTCEDGSRRSFVMISPGLERVEEADVFDHEPTPAELEAMQNRSKRLSARAENAKHTVCD